MLELKEVSGVGKGFTLKEISFSLQPGYIMGVIGKNGAGKTTLLHYILGDKPYTGSIQINGKECRDMQVSAYNDIAFISEETDFFWERSVLTNGELLGTLYDNWSEELFRSSLRKFQVPLRNSLRNLSRGEFMKFQMAFAIAHQTKLYLLDEVTAGMDPVYRIEFYDLLREIVKDETASVLLTTHLTDEMERNIDYIAVLEDGKLKSFVENPA